jgi:hypothetical protein
LKAHTYSECVIGIANRQGGKQTVERVERDLAALKSHKGAAALLADAPELQALLSELTTCLTEVQRGGKSNRNVWVFGWENRSRDVTIRRFVVAVRGMYVSRHLELHLHDKLHPRKQGSPLARWGKHPHTVSV